MSGARGPLLSGTVYVALQGKILAQRGGLYLEPEVRELVQIVWTEALTFLIRDGQLDRVGVSIRSNLVGLELVVNFAPVVGWK